MNSLLESLEHRLTTTEASRACEILRLLGYDQRIDVAPTGLTIYLDDGLLTIPAWIAATGVPSILRREIERDVIERGERARVEAHNEAMFRRMEQR